LEAAEFIHVIQGRQQSLIASPEEIALANGWISRDQFAERARSLATTEYGKSLLALLET
jgi:glucose-1-phosphate thymidylyltransferase